jgi:hypothetical protein
LAEVTAAAISNTPTGTRKVQVLRDDVVRDVEIEPVGQPTAARVLVSGRFVDGDELIVSASRQLADGTQIRPTLAAAPAAAATAATPTATTPTTPAKSSRTKAKF